MNKEEKQERQPVKEYDISGEKSRAYTIILLNQGVLHEIVINNPQKLFCGPDHYFHRIFDGKEMWLAPAPGLLYYHRKVVGYVEVTWVPKDRNNPCRF